jgi:BirA family biotin operon repressor/biotin-[acetyl-CoA-carboxylase] ligase
MKIGTVVHSLETCSSTNDVAKKLAEEGAEEGTVVTAWEQTRGRGTKGRSWHSPRGKGLYASVILRPKETDILLLPLLVGVACTEAIRRGTGVGVGLKWPNDIVWRGKKLGGILCETGVKGGAVVYAVVGLGLNISQRKNDFPEEVRPTATSLWLILKRKVDQAGLEAKLWEALERWYRVFDRGGKGEIVRAFQAKFIYAPGQAVKIETARGSRSGVFLGIDSQGWLRLRRHGGELAVSPAEVQSVE